MAFGKNWEATQPQGTQPVSTLDTWIQDFKEAVRERLAKEHAFAAVTVDDDLVTGKHSTGFITAASQYLAAAAVVATNMAADAVPAAAIQAGAVSDSKLALGAVSNSKLAPDAVLNVNVAAGAAIVESKVAFAVTGHTHDGVSTKAVDHITLTNKGTNTHAAIDTFVASKAQASGLASLDASSKVIQSPADATATPTANKIPVADASGTLNDWVRVGSVLLYRTVAFTPSGLIAVTWTNAEHDTVGVSLPTTELVVPADAIRARVTVELYMSAISGTETGYIYLDYMGARITGHEFAGTDGGTVRINTPLFTVSAGQVIRVVAAGGRQLAGDWTSSWKNPFICAEFFRK